MRSLLSLFLITTTTALISAPARADESSHWYGGFDLGLSASPDTDFSRSADSLRLSTDKNVGPVGGLYFGKKFGKSRMEFEYMIRRNNFDTFTQEGNSTTFPGLATFNAGGRQQNSSLMLNFWRTLTKSENWSFLAGAGIGLSHVSLEGLRSGQTRIADTSKWTPTFQAMAEIVRPIGEGLEIGFGYRLVRSARATFDTSIGDANYKASHNELFARISWRIGSDSAPSRKAEPIALPERPVADKPAPAPMAAKPVAPVTMPVEKTPAPLPGPFIVYFAFDKATISDTALSTIIRAAQAYREFKAVEISTAGHADRAGPEYYNEKLAQARVEAVRDILVREGVPASKILLRSEGENVPAIATQDGVREKQNRRVEITLVR